MAQLMNVINALLLPRNVHFVKRIILMKTIPKLNVLIANMIITQSPYNFACVFFPPRHMALYLKIVSFNCHGMNNDAKRDIIFAHLRQLDAQTILLQKTFQNRIKWQFGPTNGLLDKRPLIRSAKIIKQPPGRQYYSTISLWSLGQLEKT